MADDSLYPATARVPFAARFHCSRGELIADGIVHGLGVTLAISAGSVLLALSAFHASLREYIGTIFYVASLVIVLSLSAAYNMWPISPIKRALRRFDHAAIFLLIAGTYTPFLVQMNDPLTARLMLGLIWGAAALGITMKLLFPGRLERIAVVFYLAMGWSGVVVFNSLSVSLPRATLWLIAAGGIAYSIGVTFHVWRRLRYQTALWHGCVLLGAALHLGAVMDSLVISRI
ncbi:PAQR family membrane homeostasis protein TrhA [Mesorhizobium koreense]|uniref:PAQR family membrane homeostasis protein TrhA n=1 Tax=Mesorhizobium koreense TaxID=3074855 RepID=UPI00287BAA25|nr:hemolysin III family protein [Mesorhizobium sp. WR6]